MNSQVPQWQTEGKTKDSKKGILGHFKAAVFSVTVVALSYSLVMYFGSITKPKDKVKTMAPTFQAASFEAIDEGAFTQSVPANVSEDKINSLFPQIKE